MEPQTLLFILNLLFYGIVLLAIVGHIFTVFLIGNLYNDVLGAFMRKDLCGIRETEGDTVRYEVWKAMETYKEQRKLPLGILGSSIGLIVIFAISFFVSEKYLPPTETPFSFVLNIILLGIVIIAFSSTDLDFIEKISAKIKDENDKYITAKEKIKDALELIHKEYPMFQDDKRNHPDPVKNLYNLILERYAYRSKDNTIEESKQALIRLAENKQYDEIFAYLKLDATFKDPSFLKQSFCVTNKIKTNNCEKYIKRNGIDDALHTLETYHPNDIYKVFLGFIKTRLIAVFILLAFYSFPFFHIFYSLFGAVSIGIATILLALCIILFTYKQW